MCRRLTRSERRFDLRAVPPTDPALHDVEGILESATNLRSLIAKEIEAGIPAERIVIGGFSQGTATLYLFLTVPRR